MQKKRRRPHEEFVPTENFGRGKVSILSKVLVHSLVNMIFQPEATFESFCSYKAGGRGQSEEDSSEGGGCRKGGS